MAMTFTPEANKKDILKETRTSWWLRHWWIVLLAVCLIGVGAYVLFVKAQSRATKQGQVPSTPGIPVVAVEAKKASFNVYISGLGSVTPLNTVIVRTRVDGQLMEALYREGQIGEERLVADAVDIECHLRGQRLDQFAVEKGDHTLLAV